MLAHEQDEDSTFNHQDLVEKICRYALWEGPRAAVEPPCQEMAKRSNRITLSGEQTLEEVDRYEWNTSNHW